MTAKVVGLRAESTRDGMRWEVTVLDSPHAILVASPTRAGDVPADVRTALAAWLAETDIDIAHPEATP